MLTNDCTNLFKVYIIEELLPNNTWCCSDAASYAFTYNYATMLKGLYEKHMPLTTFRIVEAKCNIHLEYGISRDAYDYEILTIY